MSAATGQPKYRQIAADLRAAITAGEYLADARLPGENDIMQRYGVARMTARQALAQLINEGVATPRKGSGVYVRTFRPIVRDGIQRLSGDTWQAGKSIWGDDAEGRDLAVDQVEVREDDPPGYVSLILELPEASRAVVRSRRFVLDGKPVLLSRSYLPATLVVGTAITQVDTGPGGTYARLRELGHSPSRFREELRSRMPEEREAERLALTPGTPVVEIIRTAYTETGQAVEVNEMIADASAYVFRYSFEV